MERDPEAVETRYVHAYADLPGARVLDIGCGEGRLIWCYAATAARVVGLDLDAARLAAGRRACPPALQSRVRLVRGLAATLPFAGAQFERVIFGWSL